MAAYLCDILCTNCGEIFSDLIDKNYINDGIVYDNGSMESINYRCDRTHRLVRIRRFFRDLLQTSTPEDQKLNICPECHKNVPSFGDRYHTEIGAISNILNGQCPQCDAYSTLTILSRKEIK